MNGLLDFLPRGLTVDDEEWERRHRFLLYILAAMAPALGVFGLAVGNGPSLTGAVVAIPVVTATGGYLAHGRHVRSMFVAAGMSACCAGLVILAGGMIEAHFSFFVIIGFLALYQHWLPFVWNIVFTTISHGLGSALVPTLMFNHPMGQMDPWLWSTIHGLSVLAACIGVMMFCRITEDEQSRRAALAKALSDAQIRQREFTSDLLLNLARRNQSMFGRQLDIINDLEERERDPDTLAELFRLDHLATRVRRNAESLLVLSGEQPARVWSAPVPLRDVVRAGIAETEDLDRVTIVVDERPRVAGSAVADLTHLLAELAENAVRFSSPSTAVTVQSRPSQRVAGAFLLIIEDTGIGMPTEELATANELLAHAHEVDLSASQRLGFHVVSRLAERHDIEASLTPTPGGGVTAVLVLPAALFAEVASTSLLTPAMPVAPIPTTPSPVPAVGGDGATNGAGGAVAVTDLASAATNGAEAPDGADHAVVIPRGRHSWPGHSGRSNDDTDVHADPDTDAHTGAHLDTGARLDTGAHLDTGASLDTGTQQGPSATPVPSGRAPRALIHPIVVPPPSADRGTTGPRTSAGTTAGTTPPPAPARDDTALAPAPRRSDEGSPSLKRRVPQTHLAPELIRPASGPTSEPASGPAPAADPTPRRDTSAREVPRSASPRGTSPWGAAPREAAPTPPSGPAGMASLDALSRYQASRQAARSAIGHDDPPTQTRSTHDR